MESVAMKNVGGELFAGESKLFFTHPRYANRLPYRLETSSASSSFDVRAFNIGMVVLCDSRMNAARVVDSLYASDIGCDTSVTYTTGTAGRWANLRETSDGRHWSEGELQLMNRCQQQQQQSEGSGKPKRVVEKEETAMSRLTAQLPREAVEAVRDGRAIVISRTSNLFDHIWCNTANGTAGTYDLCVFRLWRSFNNFAYALCRVEVGKASSGPPGDVTALLFVGRLFQNEIASEQQRRPTLTVARVKPAATSGGGGLVFCVCLGDCLAKRLDGMSVEEIAKSKRHYEGYFTDADCESFLKPNYQQSIE